ncbi:Insect odorant-binding protein A10/Ejaculatory bulb-specific protein 3 [Cinara cedri]|uniref:Insect odorant-binding protein A10/Ejaculatory bulb-specific protein 3 n=1 Tax=Cinara cedri TaxID=506608 RepID=A0A5E4MNW8_9HEMI|nr:Insect odorant-binding protein A10/Ejaculatory bulb-specific protein 3 [Cinara cedri]
MVDYRFKTTLLVCCMMLAASARSETAVAEEDDIKDMSAYLKRFSSVNIDQVLSNERVINSHIKCFLNEGPCVQQSRELKKAIPIIARKGCEGCTDRQIAVIKKALNFIRTKKPIEWERLVKVYDSTGTGLKQFIE